ncbi:MAG: replicative DNA helicase [Simkaniaceae bacterium]|nr:replicative DNA helicase [Simkaniaceae bacterium]
MSEKEKIKVKVPPHSKESEMMVLGCMLTKVNSFTIAADALQAADFYFTEHQAIFHCLKGLFKSDKPADIHLVSEELKRAEKFEYVGGALYLTTLAQYAGTSAYIEEYVQVIKNKSILRRMIYAAQEIEKKALEEPSDVRGSLDEAQKAFFVISQTTNAKAGKQIKDIFSGIASESGLPYLKELEERQETYLEKKDKGEEAPLFTGIPTGFTDLDHMINGLAPSNLMILAGRPGMGKTAFALNVAENIAFKHQMPVGIFSLEMSAEQLLHRMICSQSEVESNKIQTGSLTGSEYQRIRGAVSKMEKAPMIIDDQPGLKITDLRARARRLKEMHAIQFLVIDYLQLLSGSGNYYGSDNRQGEISEISRMLKNLARELNIPILCGSQLSRKVEERSGHRPMMSDLRESGAIEQDADVVMFLLRREYYDPYDKPGLAEVIVGKNRHGTVGTVDVVYRKEFAQFANYTKADDSSIEENSKAFEAFSPTH